MYVGLSLGKVLPSRSSEFRNEGSRRLPRSEENIVFCIQSAQRDIMAAAVANMARILCLVMEYLCSQGSQTLNFR